MGLDKNTGPGDLPIEAVKILAKQEIRYALRSLRLSLYPYCEFSRKDTERGTQSSTWSS